MTTERPAANGTEMRNRMGRVKSGANGADELIWGVFAGRTERR
ncbi:MAG TPA: hypothetical protein PLV92_13245 [Pirellulaceae bacterium]|nr:hypothetical protein [Pirellulaceae bacterium]